MGSLSPQLRMSAMYRLPAALTNLSSTAHTLHALVAFSGCHYVAYCLRQGQWVCFDDACVRPVGRWEQVIQSLAEAQQMPVLLMYHQ